MFPEDLVVTDTNKEDIFEWRGKKEGETLRKSTRKPLNSPKRELINMK